MTMPTIEVLDPAESRKALTGHRFGSSAVLKEIADQLMAVVDSDSSVFVEGLNESTINALRTKMSRRSVRVVVRKVDRAGKVGHLLFAVSIK
jgi:hypothetical protein